MSTDQLKYKMDAPITRISDNEIIESLRTYYSEAHNKPFTTSDYDNWNNKVCSSATISKRFGSWRAALREIGIERGVQAREYSAQELMENLQIVWDQLGRRPGKRNLAKFGYGFSERPYINKWGSLENACRLFVDFANGIITEDQLFSASKDINVRKTIPLKDRWEVLKRDHYRCVKCGARPPNVGLEIDHIHPFSKGGSNEVSNLQTLCNLCNQGKKDRV
jgi:hypothetical protein